MRKAFNPEDLAEFAIEGEDDRFAEAVGRGGPAPGALVSVKVSYLSRTCCHPYYMCNTGVRGLCTLTHPSLWCPPPDFVFSSCMTAR